MDEYYVLEVDYRGICGTYGIYESLEKAVQASQNVFTKMCDPKGIIITIRGALLNEPTSFGEFVNEELTNQGGNTE